MIYGFLLIGLVLLVIGGDLVVRGAVALAYGLGVSSLLVSLTVIGLGTSMPELVVSIRAALAGSPGIVVGGIVGSNIANALLVMGMAALIYPMSTPSTYFRRDATMVTVSSLIFLVIVLQGFIDRVVGMGLVAMLILYVIYAYLTEQNGKKAGGDDKKAAQGAFYIIRSIVFVIGGLGLLILGAQWVVEGAIGLARMAGVSETVVGLTVVAIGTSLPELTTAIIAAMRGETSVVFGNIIGSNIQNILSILGITAVIQPIIIPGEIAQLDIWVMLGATLLMLLFAVTRWHLNRIEGGIMLTAYFIYLGYLAYAEDIGWVVL